MYEQDHFLEAAIAEAVKSRDEGGIPIGAILIADYGAGFENAPPSGKIVATGRNRRVQTGDPTAHAEVECVRAAGRRRDWQLLTMYTTLSPCSMCAGTAILFRLPRIVIGENCTFRGDEEHLRRNGVELTIFNDEDCIRMMRAFIADHGDLWNEDIGVPGR